MTDAFIASLGMYDFPWTRDANDALWRAVGGRLRAAGFDAPATLDRRDAGEVWREPGLIFGQTCGYPYMTLLRGAVALIATPIYDLPGCDGANHRSFLVARANDPRREAREFRGARAAINGWDSNSGANLFRAAIAPLANNGVFFGSAIVTGAHRRSLEAVRANDADLASIDCVTYALVARGQPDLVAALRVVGETARSPSLPFVMSAALADKRLTATRAALHDTLADPALRDVLRALGLAGAVDATDADYQRVLEIERGAIAAGYPTLA
jgi:ABC-type phosphate/phosphonate transport system substrate-binding protein